MDDMKFSAITVERYILSELPADERTRVERGMAINPTLRARIAHVKHSNENILDRYPPHHMAKHIEFKMQAHAVRESFLARTTKKSKGKSMSTLGMIALVVVALVPGLWFMHPSHIDRVNPAIVAYRSTSKGAVALSPTEPAAPGDLLHLGYVAAGQPYGTIVSLDGHGNAALLFPFAPHASTRLEQDGEQVLDRVHKLSNAPHLERFFLITSHQPVPVDAVLDSVLTYAIRSTADSARGEPGVPEGCRLTSLMVSR